MSLAPTTSVKTLKHELALLSHVLPKRQKLVFKTPRGIIVTDDSTLASLHLTSPRVMMIGTQEKDLLPEHKAPSASASAALSSSAGTLTSMVGALSGVAPPPPPPLAAAGVATVVTSVKPEPADDEDLEDFVYVPEEAKWLLTHPRTQAKLMSAIDGLTINYINQPRPGKKLLVLDLDYTLFDMRGVSDDYSSLRRPGTHEFLSALYPHYELVIWSQNGWKWLEIKLTELGLLTHSAYRILFVLDKTCMFRVKSVEKEKRGSRHSKHHVKPLSIIWSKCPHFHAGNTIHIDDLGRNFAMNPQNGLKIRAYRHATTNRYSDRELFELTRYLQLVAPLSDLRTLDHHNWRAFTATQHSLGSSSGGGRRQDDMETG